jgi:hypothetical protein
MGTPQIELKKWPAITDYLNRFKTRPSVMKALAEELRTLQGRDRAPQGGGVGVTGQRAR